MPSEDEIRYLPRMHISQAMRAFGMTARAIRFYEEFGLIEVQRDDKNRRCYDARARRRLRWISDMRSAGLGLRDIQDVIEADEASGEGQAVALERLELRRASLLQDLAAVEGAIDRTTGSSVSSGAVRHAV